MRYIVDFLPDTTSEFITTYFAANGCTVVEELSLLGQTYLVDAETVPTTEGVESVIADDPGGLTLLDIETKTFPVDDGDNWWKVAVVSGVNYDAETCEIVRSGQGQRVYLLDSGIDLTHPEFANKDITLLHSKTADFLDTTGHGTAIASVIVGETCGITEASLKVVKVFEQGQATTLSDILTALQKVAEDFSLAPERPAVMNLSWSIDKNTYVESKLAALMEMGVVVVCAAGNSGVPVQNVTPASMVSAITVGSFGPSLTPSNFTNYTGSDTSLTQDETNHGVGLDLFAPGEQIRVALVGGGYGQSAGTSIAAGVMSAVALLNLAIIRPEYEFRGYDLTLAMLREHFLSNGFLTLEAPYDVSPNAIPRVRITAYDPAVEPPRVGRALANLKAGKPFSVRLFDAPFFTSATIVSGIFEGAVIEGNYLKGTAPAVPGAELFTGMVEATDGTTTTNIPVELFVVNETAYADPADAYADANYVPLECGCGGSIPCCGWCDTKTNACDECAHAVNDGGWSWVCY